MKKVAIITCALLILSVGLMACSQRERGLTEIRDLTEITWEVTCEDFVANGSCRLIASANVGDTIRVILCSNPGTGFKWPEIAQIDNLEVLKQTHHEFVNSEQTGVVGSSSKDVWTFKVLKKGTTKVSMDYSRPWVGGEEAKRTFVAIITIQ